MFDAFPMRFRMFFDAPSLERSGPGSQSDLIVLKASIAMAPGDLEVRRCFQAPPSHEASTRLPEPLSQGHGLCAPAIYGGPGPHGLYLGGWGLG